MSEVHVQVTRRELFRYAAVGSAAVGLAATVTKTPVAHADPGLGTLVDYAGGVPSAAAIKNAGHVGVIRYVSDRRKGAEWMLGKPLRAAEVTALRAAGLQIVSCYQYGKGATADWRGGLQAGKQHAARGVELHRAAGGPDDAPIYASIDDNPTHDEFESLIAPYLQGWEAVVGKHRTGVYANSPTIDNAIGAGLGAWYWQHDWGTPKGYVHPAAHLHQYRIGQNTIDGIDVDLNAILKRDYGQWTAA